MAVAIGCDMRSEKEIEDEKKIIDLRSVQVVTVDGDTVIIQGGATCRIYKTSK